MSAKPGAYLHPWSGTCPDKVVSGPLPEVYPPESATASPSSGGHLVGAVVRTGESTVLRADLLKPDLFSKIVLLGSGALFLGSLFMVVMTALARA